MPTASPTDFAAMRAAIVAATRAATGLGQNAVVMQNAGDPLAQRAKRPFADIRIQSPAIQHGRVAWEHGGKYGDDVGRFDYTAQMSMVVAYNFFADTIDEAFALAAALQFGLDCDVIYAPLKAAGLSVWKANAVQDMTALLNTGYEGRAHLTVTFGYVARQSIDAGVIDHVPLSGVASDADKPIEAITVMADL